MKRIAFLSLAILISNAANVSAQVDDVRQVLEDCSQAISVDDRSAAGLVAERLSKMASMAHATGSLSDELLQLLSGDDAKTCLSYARQANLEFSAELGRFVSSRVRQDAEQKKREAELAEEREKQFQEAEAAQRLLELNINTKVYEACSQLANKDEIAAFTNELCVNSFKANGLPNLRIEHDAKPAKSNDVASVPLTGQNIQSCWNVSAFNGDALRTTVAVEFEVDDSGKPKSPTITLSRSDAPTKTAENLAYEAARRAIVRCSRTGYTGILAGQKALVTFNPSLMRVSAEIQN